MYLPYRLTLDIPESNKENIKALFGKLALEGVPVVISPSVSPLPDIRSRSPSPALLGVSPGKDRLIKGKNSQKKPKVHWLRVSSDTIISFQCGFGVKIDQIISKGHVRSATAVKYLLVILITNRGEVGLLFDWYFLGELGRGHGWARSPVLLLHGITSLRITGQGQTRLIPFTTDFLSKRSKSQNVAFTISGRSRSSSREPVDPDVGRFPRSGAPVLQSRTGRLVHRQHPHQSGVVRKRASGSSHTQR